MMLPFAVSLISVLACSAPENSASNDIDCTKEASAKSNGDFTVCPRTCKYELNKSKPLEFNVLSEYQKRSICVAQRLIVVVTPESLPPTRMTMSFSSDRGASRTIEWDPFVSSQLSIPVNLGRGLWTVSVRSDPSRDAAHNEVDFAWQQGDGWKESEGKKECSPVDGFLPDDECEGYDGAREEFGGGKVLPPQVFKVIAKDSDPNNTRRSVDKLIFFQFRRLPTLDKVLESITKSQDGHVGAAQTQAGNRSFVGGFDSAIVEGVSLLSEVVIDRARRQVLRHLSDEIIKGIEKPVEKPVETNEGIKEPERWSSTRGLLKSSDLDTILTTEDALPRAIAADLFQMLHDEMLRNKISGAVCNPAGCGQSRVRSVSHERGSEREQHAAASSHSRVAAPNPAEEAINCACDDSSAAAIPTLISAQFRRGRTPLASDSQTLLVQYAAVICGGNENVKACKDDKSCGAVALALAAGATCISTQRCDSRMLEALIREPSRFVRDAPCWKDVLNQYHTELLAVARGVFEAGGGAGELSNQERFARAAETVLSAERLRHLIKDKDKGKGKDNKEAKRFAAFSVVAGSAIRRDWATAFGPVPEILEGEKDVSPNVIKLIRISAAASSVIAPVSDGTAEGQRKARKAALETVIDQMADRTERAGTPIWNVSGALGLLVGGGALASNKGEEASASSFLGTPSLRFGFGVDHYWVKCPNYGLRASVMLLDVGRVVTGAIRGGEVHPTDFKESWKNMFVLGGEVGVLIARDITIGAVFQYNPASGGWLLGGGVAVVVPLFDFN